MEASDDDNKAARMASLKMRALNASSKLRQSMSKKSRRSSSNVVSVEIEDVHDPKDQEAVDGFRQVLLQDDMLPPRHDDFHILLRLIAFHFGSYFCFLNLSRSSPFQIFVPLDRW